jgi:hypothetical protein
MLSNRKVAVNMSLLAALIACNGWAQDCDERYDRSCQSYGLPPPILPWMLFQHREIAGTSPAPAEINLNIAAVPPSLSIL